MTCSTLKSKESDSSKLTSSTAITEAAADNAKGVWGIAGVGNKDVLELIDRLADNEGKANDYEVPITATTTTTFGKRSAEKGPSAQGGHNV